MSVHEVNFDGLVGPTHNYAGLSFGNLASANNKAQVSSPKQAALQGLTKMKTLVDMGLVQAVLPPHERPHLTYLRRLGFSAVDDRTLLETAARKVPSLLKALSSSSFMWVANAATVSPFVDTQDARTHITPANLSSMLHRSVEHEQTGRILQAIFQGPDYCHHPALPAGAAFSDEGAANHTRFCRDYAARGVALFVYGASAFNSQVMPQRYPARQSLEASAAIARQHRLDESSVVLAQQHPAAIDAGVFHNDVIAVGNRKLLFFHEQAFLDSEAVKAQLQAAMDVELVFIEVPQSLLSLQDAVASYLFNSQLLSVPGRSGNTLLAPEECRHNTVVHNYLEQLKAEHAAIDDVLYVDLRQSMKNGGGPACLRLRVVMSEQQIAGCSARVFLDQALYEDLKAWIERHYRDELQEQDLFSPDLLEESRQALDELTQLLALGNIYAFQTGN